MPEEEEAKQTQDYRVWRVPARQLSAISCGHSDTDIYAQTRRLIRTAESMGGSTNRLISTAQGTGTEFSVLDQNTLLHSPT